MPKFHKFGKYQIYFELRRWRFQFTIVKLVTPPKSEVVLQKLKGNFLHEAVHVPIHLAFGYGLMYNAFSMGYWFDFAINNKNIKEREQFKGIHWEKKTKYMLHHPNHST